MARKKSTTTTTSSTRKSHSATHKVTSIVRRGIMVNFYPATYTADILILEASSALLQGVPIATHIDGTSAQNSALCAVLFYDEQNYTDAVVLGIYPNGSQGIPSPAPGRVVFLASPYTIISAVVINSGTTNTYTATNVGGIPTGALGILFKAYFSASAAPAHIDLAAHGGNLSETVSIGNTTVNTQTINGGGILPLDSSGKFDVKANGGNCTVNMFIYGYTF